ncbi:precorrin-3B synthase [Microlunatus ginsengisoli]|uniref:precorrin-3B synthase n=1 Tax=Microlunatus ginsengisoli TaxID=363863 RepID=UPI0031DB69A5
MKAADRCPGVLRPHSAEDGAVVRLRLPGGQTTAEVVSALSSLAETYGNPDLQLTSRAGIQLRGLPDPLPPGVARTLLGLGLLPSLPHERVRNIVASPLTGVTGGRADLRGLIHDLDHAIIAEPALAALPGRFLFVLDDGRDDVTDRPFDLGYRATDGRTGHVLVGGAALGFPVPIERAVDTLIELAVGFLQAQHTSGVWHVRELPDWITGIANLGPVPQPHPGAGCGTVGDLGAAAGVAVPLGLLTPAQAAALARVAPGPLVITPWRGVVVPGGAAGLAILAEAGLGTDPGSPWSVITACVGGPWCARSAGSTRAAAYDLAAAGRPPTRVHISGCERRCGAPSGDHRDILVRPEPAVSRSSGAGS